MISGRLGALCPRLAAELSRGLSRFAFEDEALPEPAAGGPIVGQEASRRKPQVALAIPFPSAAAAATSNSLAA